MFLDSVESASVTFDNEAGLCLEVFGGEFNLPGFIQLDVSQSQAVDCTLRLLHHLSGSTQSIYSALSTGCQVQYFRLGLKSIVYTSVEPFRLCYV